MRPALRYYYYYNNGSDTPPDPDSLAGDFVVLRQPEGLDMSPEFASIYFVSREEPTGADENIYLYQNNF
jgi:hypothetical protein